MKKKLIVLMSMCLLALCLLAGCGAGKEEEPKDDSDYKKGSYVADTKYGKVEGEEEEGVITFKGVPYAAPPVEELRFAATEEPEKWEEVLDCTSYPPAALQISDSQDGTFSEDCLYLNIWAPKDALDGEKKYPVLVFIHGGAYAKGDASNPRYNGTEFAKDGIIQINIQYRLNALGFLNLEEMGEGAGNFGTLDQIAGLKWVQDNIEYFGGDPDKVTISGESAGAFSVSAMMLSPEAKGLFHQAILESGHILGQQIMAPMCGGDVEQSRELSAKFMESLGADNLKELQEIDGQKLADESGFATDVTNPTDYYFFPVSDGDILPKDPFEAVQTGQYNEVDILAGYNTDEGTLFVPEGITGESYEAFIRQIFGEDAGLVLERFPVDDTHDATARARQMVKYGLWMGSNIMADELSEEGGKVYLYRFDYHVPALDKAGLGVMHGSELNFVFDTLTDDEKTIPGAEDMADNLHDRWAAFIKNSDPNEGIAEEDVLWPEYHTDTRQVLKLGEETEVISAEFQDDIAFLKEILADK